ncbi:type II toxin-antitoxin system PemK/MazF family toxin [Enterococcus diestrammenae]|uniref:type II toxin-antitoxin system PemK/MazF family toxin n=1 Tax=Enterococcus diestrammenae TaxID=1155073 RepID=UPI00195A9EC4
MKNSDFVGQIRMSRFRYYDAKSGEIKFKGRPVLIIGYEKEHGPCDFTVLPISSISIRSNVIPQYDIFIPINSYPSLKLWKDCYCRTSKVNTVHSKELGTKVLGKINIDYPDLYDDIQMAFNSYSTSLFK